MELLLVRKPAADGAILGQLFIDGKFECFTLERLGVEIAAGSYPVTITPSVRFGRALPLITNVPGRSGLRIHPGNVKASTDGCVLVGHTSTVDSVLDSRLAMQQLQPKIAAALAHGDVVRITIVDPPKGKAALSAD